MMLPRSQVLGSFPGGDPSAFLRPPTPGWRRTRKLAALHSSRQTCLKKTASS